MDFANTQIFLISIYKLKSLVINPSIIRPYNNLYKYYWFPFKIIRKEYNIKGYPNGYPFILYFTILQYFNSI